MRYKAKYVWKGLTWKEGWVIYSEIRGKKGTVELGVEGSARDCAQHIYILSHLHPLSSILQNRRYSVISIFINKGIDNTVGK